ncbi:unnamed protein product [Paramecium primaurelia]|uniref:Uncharacterized protein n=1 Tax=Paramecium primaurelia TaxID=5886 RepID=A0A8S1KKL0_PARPR|nr:unnamed protein product [Paramecium primaurelia]
MIQFQQQDDIQKNEIQNQQIINSNPNEDLQEKNQKQQEQNQKLYQQLSQTENKLNLINQRVDELNQEKNQNNTMITDLKNFINQINNDQAYLDLTESLEITLQRLKEMEKKNENYWMKISIIKKKYEESLIYIKSTKEETLNQQDRIDQISQNYQQSSEDQFQEIQGLENEIRLLQQQISNK